MPGTVASSGAKFGEVVPRDVREMYDRGLQFLASKQTDKGEWTGGGYEDGPGPVGLGLLVFLASGEDPNFGQYSNHVRRSLRSLITSQDATTGIIGQSMYHHGFAMLGLAEAYGAVDERTLWPDKKGPRSIGQALELAVRAAVTRRRRTRWEDGGIHRTPPTPTPPSAARCWLACWRPQRRDRNP